jgi:flagella basal body P-ring formation protein FlgA
MVLAPEVSRSDTAAPAERVAALVAVHVGDRVVVEEHTRVAEAHLEAVALEPAVAGASFQARLKIGGRVMRVMAIAPGRAALMPLAGMPSPEAQR